MPAATRRCMDKAVTSAPAKCTLPESGFRAPETWWMKVVLPAPLGPMSAWTSPASTLKLTSFRASTAANRRDRLRTSSSASAMSFPKKCRDTLRREKHDAEQDQPEDDVPVRREADQHFFEAEQ